MSAYGQSYQPFFALVLDYYYGYMCGTSENGKQNSSLEKYDINIYKGKFYENSILGNFASEDKRAPLRHNLSIFAHSSKILNITL